MLVCNAELQFPFQMALLDECGTGVPRYDFLKNNASYVKKIIVNRSKSTLYKIIFQQVESQTHSYTASQKADIPHAFARPKYYRHPRRVEHNQCARQ